MSVSPESELCAVVLGIDTLCDDRTQPVPPVGVVTSIQPDYLPEPVHCGVELPQYTTVLCSSMPRSMAENIVAYARARLRPRDTVIRRNCLTFAMTAAGFLAPSFKDEETSLFYGPPPMYDPAQDQLVEDRQALIAGNVYSFIEVDGKIAHAVVALSVPGLHIAVEGMYLSLVVQPNTIKPHLQLARTMRNLETADTSGWLWQHGRPVPAAEDLE